MTLVLVAHSLAGVAKFDVRAPVLTLGRFINGLFGVN